MIPSHLPAPKLTSKTSNYCLTQYEILKEKHPAYLMGKAIMKLLKPLQNVTIHATPALLLLLNATATAAVTSTSEKSLKDVTHVTYVAPVLQPLLNAAAAAVAVKVIAVVLGTTVTVMSGLSIWKKKNSKQKKIDVMPKLEYRCNAY